MPDDHARLVAKVDALAAAIAERAASELSCRPGCAGCCEVELGVSVVEAKAITAHLATLQPGVRALVRARADGPPGRCVMLDDDDLCVVHPARPLVCRTQGLPLLYPAGFVPEAAIRVRTARGDVTVCPLNFVHRTPDSTEIVDAGRVDLMLALVERLDAEREGRPPGERHPLRDLAR